MLAEHTEKHLGDAFVMPEPEDYGAPIDTADINDFVAMVEKAFAPLEAWYVGEEVDDLQALIQTQKAYYDKGSEPYRSLIKKAYLWNQDMQAAARRTKVYGTPERDDAKQSHDRMIHGQIQYAIFRVNYCTERILTAAHKAQQSFKGLAVNAQKMIESGRDPREIAWNKLTATDTSKRRGIGSFKRQK
jgi:hypothetical protein